jgi:hypothetical protein
MRKVLSALALVCLLPAVAHPLELKNVRATYGPLGAVRTDNKFLPGDYLFMMYDIDDVALDDKTGRAKYKTVLELFDSKGKSVFSKETPNEVEPMLGGRVLPGDLNVIMGRDQAAGKYQVKLTVTDRVSKVTKSFTYDFEILPKSFGMVGVVAHSVGLPGQNYVAMFNLAELGLDGKKQPNVEVTMRIVEDGSKKAIMRPMTSVLPRDLPEDIDLQKSNFVPMQFPIYLNRPGRFTLEIDANDKVSKKQATLRLPLTVVDVNKLSGGK